MPTNTSVIPPPIDGADAASERFVIKGSTEITNDKGKGNLVLDQSNSRISLK